MSGASEIKVLSTRSRIVLGLITVSIVIGLLIGAASIPFVYESKSILYKFGTDKILLRTGKVLGMLAATLLLLQLLLSGSFSIIDRIYTPSARYLCHRANAVIIALFAVLHPLFVFAPEDITTIPLELEYWPEILGALLLILIWLITATSIWRVFLDFSFQRWQIFHRSATFAAVVMLVFHTIFGSDTFERGIPRIIVITAAIMYGLFYILVKIRSRL